MTFKTVVMPTDFSECAAEAMKPAVDLAQREGAELVVVHVLEPESSYAMYGMDLVLPPDIDAQVRVAAERRLAAVAESMPSDLTVRTVLRVGAPSTEVLALCDETEQPVLVIATHGRSGWRKFMIGSNVERIARLARCPVLLVPTQAEDCDGD